ncbi:DUF1934 domain-containing protein [Anaerosacchariphilus sp. NSJ-68]|uniref:DUF1934 domain-containing protein n=2 Tax=Lachnospiraceae TaxID=186803 RepID=A0A923L9Y9_9FIRM|nr:MULTISPECIES: DUF1934 domain-containing protein [Lachnospiraceae]MBC5658452.1 DUF1934 domain-containing protein [Anaerosacchariphilus hominis]MBC5698338.1 DUF1934 domain-containing protein [Roseburia difficilis]
MTKEILLSISGLHMLEEEDGNVEVVTAGDYYNRNGKHYILYDEVVEGLSGHISNRIKISGDSVEVTKKGLTNTQLIFEKGKKHMTRYQTPYGILNLGVLTRDVQVREEDALIGVKVEYILEVNEQHLAECTIEMQVKPRAAGNLSLQET